MFLKLEASYKSGSSETVTGQMGQRPGADGGLTHHMQWLTGPLLNLVLRYREHGAWGRPLINHWIMMFNLLKHKYTQIDNKRKLFMSEHSPGVEQAVNSNCRMEPLLHHASLEHISWHLVTSLLISIQKLIR